MNSELIGLWLIDSVLPLTSCVTKVELKCFYRSRFSLCKINAIILLFITQGLNHMILHNNHINIKNL